MAGRVWRFVVQRDRLIGAAFIALGALVLFETRGLEYWGPEGPGPRFVPLWAAVCIIASASWLVLGTSDPVRLRGRTARPRLLYTSLVVLAAIAFRYLGALATFAVFTFAELVLIEKYPARRALLATLVVTAAVELIFVQGFQLRLPAPALPRL